MEVFSSEGIPVIYEGEAKKVEAQEIQVFLELLKLIDNHKQDIPLLSVLRLPMFGFSLDDEAQIRLAFPDETFFYQAVEAYRDEKDDELAERLRSFYKRLTDWRELSKHLDIDDFLWRLLLESNYYSFVGSLSNGKERKRNLRLLLERAVSYKDSSLKGLPSFLQYITRLHKRDQTLLNSGNGADTEDAVRLMTIHRSKGLEFPVLFVADIDRPFRVADRKGKLIYNKRVGYGAKYLYLTQNVLVEENSLLFDAVLEQQKREEYSEEMRILYVAMTRARDQLYLVGSVKNIKNAAKDWAEGTRPERLLHKRTFLDWVMSALYTPKLLEKETVETKAWQIQQVSDVVETEIEEEEEQEDLAYSAVRDSVFAQLEKSEKKTFNNRPVKMSVTHLKRYGIEAEPVELTPLGEATEEIDYSAVGTAVHRILQMTDLKQTDSLEHLVYELEHLKKGLLERGEITEDVYEQVETKLIVNFFNSELGKRLIASFQKNPKNVLKETPFAFDITPSQVESLSHLEERPVEISGIIDACFLEDGKWILIDYKTDRFYNEALFNARLEEYTLQIELYARALEKLTGIEVAQKHIYFLSEEQDLEL